MNLYELYLSLRYNWKAYGTPPVPLIGTPEENLIFANMVLQGTFFNRDRFFREWEKRTKRESKEAC